MGNESIERRRTVHGGPNSALSVEVSAWKCQGQDRAPSMANHEPIEFVDGFGVYIRNPLAFHVTDFERVNAVRSRRDEMPDLLGQAFRYADALADHLGCSVNSALERPETTERARLFVQRCEDEARKLLEANGFEIEGGGAGIAFLSRYWPNGAHVWASDSDGGGLPDTRNFMLCVYGRDPATNDTTEALMTWRSGKDEPFLVDVIRMACRAAEAVDSVLSGLPCPRCASLETQEANADSAAGYVADRDPIAPEGFRAWTDGIAQGFHVYQAARGGVILSDLFGQEEATAESWALAVFKGRFAFDDADEAEGEKGDIATIFTVEKSADGPDFEACLAGAVAMADAL